MSINQTTLDPFVRQGEIVNDHIFNLILKLPEDCSDKLIHYAFSTVLRDYLSFYGKHFNELLIPRNMDKLIKQFRDKELCADYAMAVRKYFKSFSKYDELLDTFFSGDINSYLDKRGYEKDSYKRSITFRNWKKAAENRWYGDKFSIHFPLQFLIVLQFNFLFGWNTLFENDPYVDNLFYFIRQITVANRQDRVLVESTLFKNATDTILFKKKTLQWSTNMTHDLKHFILLIDAVSDNIHTVFKAVMVEYFKDEAFTKFSLLKEENKVLMYKLEDKRALCGELLDIVELKNIYFEKYKNLLRDYDHYDAPKHRMDGIRMDIKDLKYDEIDNDAFNNELFTEWDGYGGEIQTRMTSKQMIVTEEEHNKYIRDVIDYIKIDIHIEKADKLNYLIVASKKRCNTLEKKIEKLEQNIENGIDVDESKEQVEKLKEHLYKLREDIDKAERKKYDIEREINNIKGKLNIKYDEDVRINSEDDEEEKIPKE